MSYTEIIRGSIPALVTPFTQDGEIDLNAFKNLVSWHVDNGTHGLVICGTTGESPNISDEEHSLLVKTAIETAPKGFPIIAGCGSNSTLKTIKLTKAAEALGATAALIVVPYYNKPSQSGLFAHFKAVHDATNLPIILYNVPSRTIVDMSDETVIALAELPSIIGIKDATGDINRLKNQKAHITKDFVYLSGDDMSALEYIISGGNGCISVTANIVPQICASIFNNTQIGDINKAKEQDNSLAELHKKMFIEPSPAAPKYLLSKQGHIQNILRLPLLPLTAASADIVEDTLKQSMKNGCE